MTYFPPDIIDNASTIFAEALSQTILKAEQQHLDIATGYFAPDVWRIVGNAFAELYAFRLLLGERPDVPTGGPQTVDLRRYYRAKIADDLARLNFDRQHAELVDTLLAFLMRDEVQVRLFSGPFLHAKAYIFDQISFVGSSNFTPSGLTRNSELMLTSMSQAVAKGLREWFDGKWLQSEDYKPDLIETLRASKFGSKHYTPFEVFMKALYEYFKERILLEQDRVATVDLARFQEEGKAEALRLLDKWGGVLVADAVGLGKTYIGLSLLERELLTKRKRGRIPRGLVVCPAQLRDLVWRPRLVEYGIPVVDVLSQEEIGRADFDWKRYRDLDVVVVDESHNFRNPNTNRYRNLMKLLTGGRRKRVILMTATPVNNSLYDFYHQLLLLARGEEHFYRQMGISNLRSYFKAAMEGGLEIFDLLEETTVRRSRADIRRRQDAGEEVVVSGKPVRFPERMLERIDYDLDGTYRGLYHEITSALDRLHLVTYNLAAYAHNKTKASEQDEQRNNALIALMKMLYLKRLESSAAAFEESVKRQALFQSGFLKMLREGKLLDAASYRKLLAIEAGEERAERADEIISALPVVSPQDYNMQRIEEGVNRDITVLNSILLMLKRVRENGSGGNGDDKVRQVKTVLAGTLKEQKVLIFTSYHDTAAYLHQQLLDDTTWQEQAGKPVLGLISGNTKPEERRKLIERFAPIANRPPEIPSDQLWQPDGAEIQVLISTDVLSEGQNLQDAGVVINYDLHWNPVRLIQRAGRVDRIGSSFAHIMLYNVFPEADLESLLGLIQKLSTRIAQIDQTVGLDASVLGEVISQRSLEQLRQLHRNDQNLLQDLERQAELVSTEEMKFPLINYIQQIGERVVAEIPLGIHSGKRYIARDARPGIFVAMSARGRHFWRFYPDDGSEPEKNIRTLYAMIACTREETRLDPGPIPYDLLERATQDVLATLRGEQARNRVRPALTGMAQKLYNWLNRPTLWQENEALDPDQLRRFNGVLEQISLRPFERDRSLKVLVKAYQVNEDFTQLVLDLDSFFAENGLYQESDVDIVTAEAIKEEDLRLVCYERLTTS
ncbi:helicase-related protein [Ktedonospora formicarum]|uniref:Helicase n=1 Tax=Ktedonospora formicarum TaxID=2778364 RepID=A0A8J3IGK9_9CHLR|nr:helicase-related protein [Ktedonospora formicarum]GHO51454.1 helicase [Ktedonospora formicarum]